MARRKQETPIRTPINPPITLPGVQDQDFGQAFIRAVYEAAREQCQCASCQFMRILVSRQLGKEE